MENRYEDAISHSRGQISQKPLKNLKAFHKKTAEKLSRQINCFSNLLEKTIDPKKRNQIARWLSEWRAEQNSLLQGWRNSKIRRDLAEEFPMIARSMDEVLEFKHHEVRSDVKLDRQREIDRKYRLAGRIIDRNKSASLC